jgi:hypothetical protein
MRLPLPSTLHRLLDSSHDVARGNARATLELLGRRRREREEVESYLRERERELEIGMAQ